jgi:putative FmdB family regulatory protein
MPIYEYRRPDGTTFEVLQSFSDDPLTVDPETGVPVERVLNPPAVHFKGKGFYNTDYGTRARQRETAAAAEGGSSSESRSDSGGSEGGSTSDTGSGSGKTAGGSDSAKQGSGSGGAGSGGGSSGGGSSGGEGKKPATSKR